MRYKLLGLMLPMRGKPCSVPQIWFGFSTHAFCIVNICRVCCAWAQANILPPDAPRHAVFKTSMKIHEMRLRAPPPNEHAARVSMPRTLRCPQRSYGRTRWYTERIPPAVLHISRWQTRNSASFNYLQAPCCGLEADAHWPHRLPLLPGRRSHLSWSRPARPACR